MLFDAQGWRQVFRTGGSMSSGCRLSAGTPTPTPFHSSKKYRICANLIGRPVEVWGSGPLHPRPTAAPVGTNIINIVNIRTNYKVTEV